MKSSPGSMIGGIGFTIWVRALHFSRTIAQDLVNLGVVDAQHDGGVGLLEEPARAVDPGRPELAPEQGVDEGAGVLVVHDRNDEFHGAEDSPSGTPRPNGPRRPG